MTDHTPTTDEVRAEYVSQGWAPDGSLYGENDPAEFDRWLAQHNRKVAAEALRALGQEFHDWAALHAGPDGAYFALVWKMRIRVRADRIEQGGES